jgi:anti-anti-sigma factor
VSAPRPFETRVDPDGVVWLSGELDMATADPFTKTVFANVDGQQLVLDLSELTFLDSTGIRAIFELARARQEAVVLRNLRPNVRNVLAIAGGRRSDGRADRASNLGAAAATVMADFGQRPEHLGTKAASAPLRADGRSQSARGGGSGASARFGDARDLVDRQPEDFLAADHEDPLVAFALVVVGEDLV